MNKYCIANWKMYMNKTEIDLYFKDFISNNFSNQCNLVFCPSSIHLDYVNGIIKHNKNIFLGSQNVSEFPPGAYTGEVSLQMIKDSNCRFSIIGHSERRVLFNETDSDINKKLKVLNNSNITPIVCIGETLEQNESGETKEVLEKQLKVIFQDIELSSSKEYIIAYEPIWAIGTGKSASNDTIHSVHNFLKNIINEINLNNCNICLLYGGSVNENNASEILSIDGVDGFLIGSASIDADKFYSIYNKF